MYACLFKHPQERVLQPLAASIPARTSAAAHKGSSQTLQPSHQQELQVNTSNSTPYAVYDATHPDHLVRIRPEALRAHQRRIWPSLLKFSHASQDVANTLRRSSSRVACAALAGGSLGPHDCV
jgi:hypothetical protein